MCGRGQGNGVVGGDREINTWGVALKAKGMAEGVLGICTLEEEDIASRVKMPQARISGNRLVPDQLSAWNGQWLPWLWSVCSSL